MRVSKRLAAALARGWRNLDGCVTDEEHAEATIRSLREAGYVIVKVERPMKR